MKPFYDLIIGLCSYKSAKHTLNMIESANNIDGDILFFVTCGTDMDAAEMLAGKNRAKKDLVVCKTNINSRYFCNNWAFVSCINNGVQSSFYGTMDDDILFIDCKGMIDRLYKADELGFSVLGLWSSSHAYPSWAYEFPKDKEYRSGLLYVDGHNMFTHYTDNILYGLCDSVGEGNISYVEAEYCTRMEHFTGKPILADVGRKYLYHIFRADPELNVLRKEGATSRDMAYGIQLYKDKYGIDVNPLWVEYRWQDAVNAMKAQPEKMKQHLLYDGLWNDWDAIYKKYAGEVKNVLEK